MNVGISTCCVVQTDSALLTNNSAQHCWMLHVAYVCTPCCLLLDVVGCCCAKLKPVKLFSQQLPTFLLFRDRRSVVQQCWIRLHSSSNIVGAKHAHYAWFTKTHGLYPPTTHCRSQHCWELLHPFAHHYQRAKMLGVVASVFTKRKKDKSHTCLKLFQSTNDTS